MIRWKNLTSLLGVCSVIVLFIVIKSGDDIALPAEVKRAQKPVPIEQFARKRNASVVLSPNTLVGLFPDNHIWGADEETPPVTYQCNFPKFQQEYPDLPDTIFRYDEEHPALSGSNKPCKQRCEYSGTSVARLCFNRVPIDDLFIFSCFKLQICL